MKKFLLLLILVWAPVILVVRVAPVHAEAVSSDAKPDPDKAKDEAKKKEEEGGPETESKDKTGDKSEGGKKKGTGDVTGGKFAGDPIYVRLAPIVLPIILQNHVEQLVTVQIAIEVKDFEAGDSMNVNMPRVMDALNRALYGSLGDGSARNGPMVDVDKLKNKATVALQNLMGPDSIKDVLIVNLSQRLL